MDTGQAEVVCLYLLGQTRAVWQASNQSQALTIQPKPLHLLAYLALKGATRNDSPTGTKHTRQK